MQYILNALLLVVCWFATCSISADEVVLDPLPRATRASTIHTWSFAQGIGGWRAEHQCTLAADGGRLVIRSEGEDPYFHSPVDLPGGRVALTLRVRAPQDMGGGGSVFWTTDQAPRRGEDQRADFELIADGHWHETTARFRAPGKLTDLRIDPGVRAGTVEIEWIRLDQEEEHPLTIVPVSATTERVQFELTNHRATPVQCTIDGTQRTLAAGEVAAVVRPVRGDRALEEVTVTVHCEDWPSLQRTVWIEQPQVDADWISKPLDGYLLQVARDGTLARIRRNDRTVALLGPLVTEAGHGLKFELTADGPVLRFRSGDTKLEIATEGCEISVLIDSPQEVEGPIVRAQGGLEQGLLAGLEYLGKGERSSSTLDIETDEHIRFAPDPLKVTMPLMAFVTDRGSVAMTWSNMELQPIYATPNFFDATADHRMALQGRRITATIRVDQTRLEDTILWAVREHGLPPLPPAPRTRAEQQALCLKALNGPLQTKDGWGHCVQPNWGRQPLADMASTMWRLGQNPPDFGRLVPGGAHVPNHTIYFVTGQAEQWLEAQHRQARGLLSRQQPDGSYRYNGEYRRGHFEDTASGWCATPAARLLEYAWLTGDPQALAGGLRTLEYMKRFRTPRGAQVWECPLHIPDQLASAYLVWAYVRGYQLTGNQEYLDLARRWALSGIPFTYQWECYPIMAYATPPVYGATHWKAPNWMGLPVQWVGGVYAYALGLLAPLDQTLDWNQLARGILISAQQQQYPDGTSVGLLPDSFNIRRQRRQPADINPCALVSLQMLLDGEVDSLAVAVEGPYRVAAPFAVTVKNGQATIQGRAGTTYQILVNGQARTVTSTGQDIVDLTRPAAKN